MNWAAYTAALKAHGSLSVRLNKDMQSYAPVSGTRYRPLLADSGLMPNGYRIEGQPSTRC